MRALWLMLVIAACVPPPARSRRLTAEQMAAIPTSFPVNVERPSDAYLPLYAQVRERDPYAAAGTLISTLVDLRFMRVPITVRECGQSNAYYKGSTREIEMCWELAASAQRYIDAEKRDGASMRVAMLYATLHEIGHALVHHLALDLEGSEEEDYVDGFAFLVFTSTGDQEVAWRSIQSPALYLEGHGRHQREAGVTSDGIHREGEARARLALCMYYGVFADPRARPSLARPDGCAGFYDAMRTYWNRALRLHTRLESGNTF